MTLDEDDYEADPAYRRERERAAELGYEPQTKDKTVTTKTKTEDIIAKALTVRDQLENRRERDAVTEYITALRAGSALDAVSDVGRRLVHGLPAPAYLGEGL